MAVPTLKSTVTDLNVQIVRLEQFKLEAEPLEAKYQHIIAEMTMLRLFSLFEDAVAELAFKLTAGAKYTNGLTPTLSTRARRISDSRGLLLAHGRPRPVSNLKWTKAQYIRESVENVIPVTEKFVMNAQAHGQIIDEMRRVRNVLAHNTPSAKADFKAVVRQNYGANISITVGAFLLSTRRTTPCNMEKYFVATKAIVAALASGT
jgi:hypothetical protein